jgi:hypothetical protein
VLIVEGQNLQLFAREYVYGISNPRGDIQAMFPPDAVHSVVIDSSPDADAQ